MVAPRYYEAGGLPFKPRRTEFRGIDLATEPVRPEPHPEVGAETRTLHLWLVESAVFFHVGAVDAISAAVCLPPWNVRRALHALALAGTPTPNVKLGRTGQPKASRLAERVAAWVEARGKPATAADVADGCGIPLVESAFGLLDRYPDRFRRVGSRRGSGPRPSVLWDVVRVPANRNQLRAAT